MIFQYVIFSLVILAAFCDIFVWQFMDEIMEQIVEKIKNRNRKVSLARENIGFDEET